MVRACGVRCGVEPNGTKQPYEVRPPFQSRSGAVAESRRRLRNLSVPTSRRCLAASENGAPAPVEDVGAQTPGVQVDAGVESVLTGVESHGSGSPV